MTPDETLTKASAAFGNLAAEMIRECKSADSALAVASAMDAAASAIFVEFLTAKGAAEYYYGRADKLATKPPR